MNTAAIVPIEEGMVHAVIETPRGSQNKYVYDPRLDVFLLKKALPAGMVFPFDFGFVPNTKAADGDPVDVLVIMDQQGFPGCLVRCRLLGVLEATQKEGKGKPVRNDRLIAVAEHATLFADVSNIKDLNKHMVREMEQFFINYNRSEGKLFEPLNWSGAHKAQKLLEQAVAI